MSLRRMWIVTAMLGIAATVVVARTVQIALLEHGEWLDRARRQQERVITAQGLRGAIRSADGYVLATSLDRLAVQVDTHLLTYSELFARAAAPLLEVDPDELYERLSSGPRAVWLIQRATKELASELVELAPAAVVMVPDSQRVYPLGFVGREELTTLGRAGLEHHYDALLAGEPETYMAVRDAVQRQIRLERVHAGRPGYDLELTLHARLQAECEAEVQRALAETGAHSASAVVLEANTGAIVAAVSLPSFEPTAPGESTPGQWKLRPVQSSYEPGSTIKPIIAAAALAAGKVHRGEVFDCTKRGITVAGRWFRDHADPGMYSLDEVVAQSANAGAIMLAERLSPSELHVALAAFGFGQRTDVGFPGESAGLLPSVSEWSRLSQVGMALGQELTVSPLQLAAAYAAIANGGWLPRPSLVARAGVSSETQYRCRVLDAALAERLQGMLEQVVTDGTGGLAATPGYRVAGKTGTAQQAFDGGFDNEHHVSWFAGFFPLPQPAFVIVVTLENPREDYWAASVAAPLFARLVTATARHFSIPPRAPLTESAGAHT
jgi:cell division protein FtsI (penicillin-binding protein 3)